MRRVTVRAQEGSVRRAPRALALPTPCACRQVMGSPARSSAGRRHRGGLRATLPCARRDPAAACALRPVAGLRRLYAGAAAAFAAASAHGAPFARRAALAMVPCRLRRGGRGAAGAATRVQPAGHRPRLAPCTAPVSPTLRSEGPELPRPRRVPSTAPSARARAHARTHSRLGRAWLGRVESACFELLVRSSGDTLLSGRCRPAVCCGEPTAPSTAGPRLISDRRGARPSLG
jgi:hypothetical protein